MTKLLRERIVYQAYENEKHLDRDGIKIWTSFVHETLYHLDLSRMWKVGQFADGKDFLKNVKERLYSKYRSI